MGGGIKSKREFGWGTDGGREGIERFLLPYRINYIVFLYVINLILIFRIITNIIYSINAV